MVQFNKLRLTGFKSFVETTDLEIGHGLTGIIGPNGCGKSNLVEALRWAMGETSAKRMRGSGMEDVIFNGTDRRPARNIAEVSLWLDNSKREAPAELNHADELEIIRKIERDHGSAYKVNGKTVRAKDVQLLFADVSIGANSPALVSQGRVADLINAKPTQRRLILEEAAGISGLHARRHEAELKLRGAETNLTRVEDVVGQMETQLGGLQKQARQAARYRNLSGHIQKAEASVLYLKHKTAITAVDRARAAFNEAENIVRELTVTVTQRSTEQTDTAGVLPDLRKAEAEAAATLQHLKITYGQIESEEERLEAETARTTSQLMQIKADLDRETQLTIEATETVSKLTGQLAETQIDPEAETEKLNAVGREKENKEQSVTKLDEKTSALTEDLAARTAKRDSLEQQISNAHATIERSERQLEDLKVQKENLLADTPEQDQIKELENAVENLVKAYNAARDKRRALEEQKTSAEESAETTLETYQKCQQNYTKLNAEADTLHKLLYTEKAEDYPPVIDSVTVEGGFEKALAAALGDDLQAALNDEAPIHWQALPAYEAPPALPKGATSVLDLVDAPPALERCLSQIGVTDTSDQARALMEKLKPGQCLVTKSGAAFRWDGLSIRDDAISPSAQRLEQRNRLKDMQSDLEAAAIQLKKAEEERDKSRKKRADIEEKLQSARQEALDAERVVEDTRAELDTLKRDTSKTTETLSRLSVEIDTTHNSLESQRNALKTLEQDFKALPAEDGGREKLVELHEKLNAERGALLELQSQLNQIISEKDQREQQIVAFKRDIENWNTRKAQSQSRVEELSQRKAEIEADLQSLTSRPDEITGKKDALRDQIAAAEQARNAAADKLAAAENDNLEYQRALKEVESKLADARESRAMAQAAVSTAKQALETIEAQIDEKFSCAAHHLLEKVELKAENLDDEDIDKLNSKLERLVRERENMGPVNLRAEVESQELLTQMETMQSERDDLLAAITRLRQGISKLNKEARERLLIAFETVNQHFAELFQVLFGGGSAHLELTDADDPLAAGLEIYAQPPGKKLQILSLFSGGEQTLTSIALIFGMFLTNPAPICVLDEIDAPLDESNVDRVCTLLEKMANDGNTRFIVITHHRMTMARMNRLYGVTMSERGVSQLVSVDMSQPDLFKDSEAA